MIEGLDGVGAFEGIYFAMHLDSRLRENDGGWGDEQFRYC